MRHDRLEHRFVEFIPEQVDAGTLYVSIDYATAVHRCCCGCGSEVVTPLSPTDWRLIFDGESISLDPSIGNWNLPCSAHYWIRRGRVVWSGVMTQGQIEFGRERDRLAKAAYFENPAPAANAPGVVTAASVSPPTRGGLWSRLIAAASSWRK